MNAFSEGPGDHHAAGYHGVLKTIGRAGADLYVLLRDWMVLVEASTAALNVGDTANGFLPSR